MSGTAGFQKRLDRAGVGINSIIAIVVLFGYMTVDQIWSPKEVTVAIGLVIVLSPIIGFTMRLLHDHFNKVLYKLLDDGFKTTPTDEELKTARLSLLLTPWLAVAGAFVTWTLFVTPVFYLIFKMLGEPSQSLLQMALSIFCALPLILISVLIAFEEAVRPYVRLLFPNGGVESVRSRFLPTVRRRLFFALFMIGPYSIGLFALLVVKSLEATITDREVLARAAGLDLFLLCISLAIYIVSANYVRKSVDQPLKELKNAVESVHRGDLTVRLPVQSFDDWGVMADRFNEMAIGLQEKERLSKENEELLKQINERAKALETLLKLYEEASQQARTDALSGLYNRRAFEEHMVQHFLEFKRYNAPFGIVIFDIDHFKKFNDTYGHAIGDNVISAVARALKLTLRLSDIPARWGGEEFIACLPHMDLEGSCVVAQRVRIAVAALELEDAVAGKLPQVTVSLGVAIAQPGDQTIDAIIERADKGLYTAKESGRNRVCCLEPQFEIAMANAERALNG